MSDLRVSDGHILPDLIGLSSNFGDDMPCYNSATISLYCDNPVAMSDSYDVADPNEHLLGQFPTIFHGRTIDACRRQAEQKGWRFFRNRVTVCPRCKVDGRKLKPRY
jgi:hypothetical protein